MRNVQASQARDRQQKLNRGKNSISALTRKKKKVYWLLQSSSSIQIHTKVYKQHSKWHVFYATLKWTNINQKLDITLSVRLCTNIKQIKTYITMAVTWVRINYWIQQKTVFNVQSRNHFFFFFLSHTNKASKTGINSYKTVFIATKHIPLALNERAMDFYILCKRKEKLLLQNNTDM